MKLVFATNNRNKITEIQGLLPRHIEVLTLKDIGCNEQPPETQATIMGNAIQKAEYISTRYNCDCFADDTGLIVHALNGAPGVHSARYAGSRNADDNIQKVLGNLASKNDRTALFKTVIALCVKGQTRTFMGVCNGQISLSKQGIGGFGYDPIFMPQGHAQTFAEMPMSLKNNIGHRGKAIEKLTTYIISNLLTL